MLIAITLAAALAGNAQEAFNRMRSLQGAWKGTVRWTGAITQTGQMDARYRVTGRGSALIEDLLDGDQPVMTSVYHLDNSELRMTHYCGAQNQPRLKAGLIDLANNLIRFDFVDITSLSAPDAPHVHGLTIHLVDKDHVELEFAFSARGKESVEHISLTRAG
jgi:hypothetical protein